MEGMYKEIQENKYRYIIYILIDSLWFEYDNELSLLQLSYVSYYDRKCQMWNI